MVRITKQDIEQEKKNRRNVRKNLGELLTKNTFFLLESEKDKINSDIFYLTGVGIANASLLIMKGSKDIDYTLFAPQPDEFTAVWQTPVLSLKEIEKIAQIVTLNEKTIEGYKKSNTKNLTQGEDDLSNKIASFRVIKTEQEIKRLRRSAEITSNSFDSLMKKSFYGETENSLASLMNYYFIRNGRNNEVVVTAFPTIVATSEHALCLHFDPGAEGTSVLPRKILFKDHLVVDAGAKVNGYSCDVTRTIPASRTMDGYARAVYNVVLETEKKIITQVRPSMTFSEVYILMMENLVDNLIQEGALAILSKNREFLVYSKEMAKLTEHGPSHMLGIDTHDSIYYTQDQQRPTKSIYDTLRYFNSEVAIPEGAVITVEPGLYLRRNSAILKKSYRSIGGMRIEDTVLVTKNGGRSLTDSIPKDLDGILRLRPN